MNQCNRCWFNTNLTDLHLFIFCRRITRPHVFWMSTNWENRSKKAWPMDVNLWHIWPINWNINLTIPDLYELFVVLVGNGTIYGLSWPCAASGASSLWINSTFTFREGFIFFSFPQLFKSNPPIPYNKKQGLKIIVNPIRRGHL